MLPFDTQSRHPIYRYIAAFITLTLMIQGFPATASAAVETVPSAITGFRSNKSTQDDKVRKLLTEQLKSNKEIDLEDDAVVTSKLQDYSSAMADPKSQAVVATAYEHYNTGMQYYRKLDLANALKEFNAAVRGYREGISILRDNYYLLFSHLYLGIILNFLGREEEGKKFIQEMVTLDADRKSRALPQRDFSPKIVELHKQVTKEVLARQTSTLSVDSVPSGAKIMFDGSEIGKTPFVVKDIPNGQHFLSLDLVGYQYYGAPIQVNPGNQSFTTNLKEKNLFVIYAPEARTEVAKNDLKAVAQKLDVDVLVLGQAGAEDGGAIKVQTQTYDARTGTFSEVFEENINIKTKKPKFETMISKIKDSMNNKKVAGTKTTATTQAKKDKTTKEVEKEAAPAPAKKITDTPIPPVQKQQIDLGEFEDKSAEKKSNPNAFYKKWWFWTAIGVAAVAGGSAVLLSQDRSSSSNIVTIPNPL